MTLTTGSSARGRYRAASAGTSGIAWITSPRSCPASRTGYLDYDARVRGTAVESRREAALAEIARLIACLEGVAGRSPDTPVWVDVGSADVAPSTLARELAFVASHTIHHFALVALLLHDLGVRVPPRFGYAPSTPSPELAA